jgi:hypothetical protein
MRQKISKIYINESLTIYCLLFLKLKEKKYEIQQIGEAQQKQRLLISVNNTLTTN